MRGAKYTKIVEYSVDSTGLDSANVDSAGLDSVSLDSAPNFAESSAKSLESAESNATLKSAQSWLDALKVAIVNKNETQCMNLVENLPHFENINDLQSARTLILQVGAWMESEKKDLGAKIEKLKLQKRFLR